MQNVSDVARYLIHLAAHELEPDYLSPLRLQKLLYYAQGWHLAIFGTPLFQDRLEAWKYGPVVPAVYQQFKSYDYQPIPTEEGQEPATLNLRERLFLQSLWDAYKIHSALGLRDMTHREAPWLEARHGLAEDARSDEEISLEAMKRFFSRELARKAIPGLSVQATYEGAVQLEEGLFRSHQEVFAQLRNPS